MQNIEIQNIKQRVNILEFQKTVNNAKDQETKKRKLMDSLFRESEIRQHVINIQNNKNIHYTRK